MYLAYNDKNILFKILSCLLISVFLILTLSSSCFAGSSVSITMNNGDVYELPNFSDLMDGYDSYIIVDGSNNNVGRRTMLIFYNKDSYTPVLRLVDGSYSLVKYKAGNVGDSRSMVKYDYYYLTTSLVWQRVTTSDASGYYFDGGIVTYYSSESIYDLDGNLVFQVAPQEGELITIVNSIDFLEVMAEVLVILPILLVVVIGLLALRKGIRLLFQMLRKA